MCVSGAPVESGVCSTEEGTDEVCQKQWMTVVHTPAVALVHDDIPLLAPQTAPVSTLLSDQHVTFVAPVLRHMQGPRETAFQRFMRMRASRPFNVTRVALGERTNTIRPAALLLPVSVPAVHVGVAKEPTAVTTVVHYMPRLYGRNPTEVSEANATFRTTITTHFAQLSNFWWRCEEHRPRVVYDACPVHTFKRSFPGCTAGVHCLTLTVLLMICMVYLQAFNIYSWNVFHLCSVVMHVLCLLK